MGGRGAKSGNTDKAKIETLRAREMDLLKKADVKVNAAIQMYKDNSGFSQGPDKKENEKREKAKQEWFKISNEAKELKARASKLATERKELELKAEKKANSTYINGYGEATRREITSSTYKRAVNRKQKDLDNWFRR